MKKFKYAVLGCGFWSKFQVGAWSEIPEVELSALYNRTRSKAETLAKMFHANHIYDNAEELLENEKPDFIDIITDVDTHFKFVEMAAEAGIRNIICQKPMAPDFATAKKMLAVCEKNNRFKYCRKAFCSQGFISIRLSCFR